MVERERVVETDAPVERETVVVERRGGGGGAVALILLLVVILAICWYLGVLRF
jgi:hypothetical protein